MPYVPAVCDACGNIFSSGIYAGHATYVTFEGNAAGPCPTCGSMGHIPDGTFNFTEDTIELLRGPTQTVSELQRLAEILRDARERNASVEEVAETIQREAPQSTRLAELLPQLARNFTALYKLCLL